MVRRSTILDEEYDEDDQAGIYDHEDDEIEHIPSTPPQQVATRSTPHSTPLRPTPYSTPLRPTPFSPSHRRPTPRPTLDFTSDNPNLNSIHSSSHGLDDPFQSISTDELSAPSPLHTTLSFEDLEKFNRWKQQLQPQPQVGQQYQQSSMSLLDRLPIQQQQQQQQQQQLAPWNYRQHQRRLDMISRPPMSPPYQHQQPQYTQQQRQQASVSSVQTHCMELTPRPTHSQLHQQQQQESRTLLLQQQKRQLNQNRCQLQKRARQQQMDHQLFSDQFREKPTLSRQSSETEDLLSIPSTITQPDTSDPAPPLSAYYRDRLGKLPPVIACINVNPPLAAIPIREIDPKYSLTALHQHFISRNSVNELWKCQVPSCPWTYGTENTGTNTRMKHAESHVAMYAALKAYRNEQERHARQDIEGVIPLTNGGSTRNEASYVYGPSVFNSSKTRMELAKKSVRFQPKQQKSYETKEFKQEVVDIVALHLSIRAIPFTFLKCSMVSELFAAHGIDFSLPGEAAVSNAQVTLYHNSLSVLRAMFAAEVIKGSLTFDGWTHGHRKFNGITFHHIDEDFIPRTTVIGFIEYSEKSTAQVISNQLLRTLKGFNLVGRAFASTTDSAANMKSTNQILLEEEGGIQSWLPCAAHLMQNVMKKTVAGVQEVSQLFDRVEKLVSVLKKIVGNKYLQQARKDIGKGELEVLSYTDTRWSSKVLMGKRILELGEAIERIAENCTAPTADKDQKKFWKDDGRSFLSAEEIMDLAACLEVLNCAAEFTNDMSSSSPAISLLYPMVRAITEDDRPLENDLAARLRTLFIEKIKATFKMDSIRDEVLVATFLHPSNTRDALFLPEDDDIPAECLTKVKDLLREEIRTLASSGIALRPDPKGPPVRLEDLLSQLDHDLDTYMDLAESYPIQAEEKARPELWWRLHQRSIPVLSLLARVFLSIQASSAASERLFSLSGNILTNKRNIAGQKLMVMVLLASWDRTYNNESTK